jgi:hypothetical protein
MILEGIVTTRNDDGTTNVAPMGPEVEAGFSSLVLKPFQSSRTFANLAARPEGVFHVVDDVLLLARAAVDRFDQAPATQPAVEVAGDVLCDACRWYEFRIVESDTSQDRARLRAHVVHCGRLRDFFGFNRAKHAVLEASILATRVHILPAEEIKKQFAALHVIVEKTAGADEREAFALLEDSIRSNEKPAS